ncbi:MAG: hypothetical protein N3D20_02400, partial [Candidatus Pacearchaeota archaeon]|nr:hypothetical protein [Candidatus Pacearchaeota archaeon]
AKKLNFDTSEYETFWTEGASNWYYTETTKRGTINFEITNIGSGDDLDLYVYDNLVSNLLCSSEKASNNNEKCTVTKNTNANWRFYIKVIP